jgi:hypothetical protein
LKFPRPVDLSAVDKYQASEFSLYTLIDSSGFSYVLEFSFWPAASGADYGFWRDSDFMTMKEKIAVGDQAIACPDCDQYLGLMHFRNVVVRLSYAKSNQERLSLKEALSTPLTLEQIMQIFREVQAHLSKQETKG